MRLGHQLIKEQLFFRKELRERVYWFIQLRWVALIGAGLVCLALVRLEPGLPVFGLTLLILGIAGYNILFLATWQRLKSYASDRVRPFEVFAHIQIAADLAAFFCFVCFTGGIHSPILVFVIFHIILAGILLSPASCFAWAVFVVLAFGGLIGLSQTEIFSRSPVLLQTAVFNYDLQSPGALFLFLFLAAYILISAFLTTSIKASLRLKGRELLRVSKELETSNAKLMALYEMVKEMGSLYDLQKFLDSVTRNASVIMRIKGCSIKLLDQGKEAFKLSSAHGLGSDCLAEEAAGMCLPLAVKQVILGRICFYSEQSRGFDAEDKVFCSLIADLTALGIDNIKRELNKTWFLSKAAHQLRSPMNAIYSMLDMVQKQYQGQVNEAQKETLQRCLTRIEMLGHMINDLLKIGIQRSRTDNGPVPAVDLKHLLQNLADLYTPRAMEKEVTLDFHMDDHIPLVRADKQLLDDLFSNLISNAVTYTPAKGEIRIVLAVEDLHQIFFQVSDTGIGIPEEDLPNIFSEFFRSENARAFSENGTGLGLIIVKEALERLRGTLSVESKLGKGTRFSGRFPV